MQLSPRHADRSGRKRQDAPGAAGSRCIDGKPFGPPGQEVPTPNLTPGGELAAWSEQGFFTTMRTGMTPEGRILNDDMPWKYFGQMSDDELRAVWMYLQSLPALEQGGL